MRDSQFKSSRGLATRCGLALMWCVLAASVVGAQERFDRPYFVEITPQKRTRVEITEWTTAPDLTVHVWGVMVAIPPEFDGQADVHTAIRSGGQGESIVTVMRDTSPLRQPVFMVHLPVDKPRRGSHAELRAVYDVTPNSRRLKAGQPATAIAALHASQRAAFTAATKEYDFQKAAFEQWLRDRGLLRNPRETDLALGHHVFRGLVKALRYQPDPEELTASIVCTRGGGACGSLSVAFVAAMRANGVPARALYGRYIRNSAKYFAADDTIHVRAEFYAEGVGWIPVDVAAATNPEKNPDDFFGHDAGDLLVLHLDRISWGTDCTPLQSMWFGFGDQEGTWEGTTRTGRITVTDPDTYLRRPP